MNDHKINVSLSKMSKQKKKIRTSQNKKHSILGGNDRENIYSRLRKRNRGDILANKIKNENSDEEFEKLLLPHIDQEENVKHSGFWSKKVKDLDKKCNLGKKRNDLYDFDETVDSTSSVKRKKRPKANCGKENKKNLGFQSKSKKESRKATEIKKKEEHRLFLVKEQIMINQEKDKLAFKNDKFTFSTNFASLGVTSTPACKKINIIGASNFLFISPVTAAEEQENSNNYTKNELISGLGIQTPKQKSRFSRITRNNSKKKKTDPLKKEFL